MPGDLHNVAVAAQQGPANATRLRTAFGGAFVVIEGARPPSTTAKAARITDIPTIALVPHTSNTPQKHVGVSKHQGP